MPGTTPVYGFPYPEPTDLVADYPALGQQLAEDIESVLPTVGGVAPAVPTSIANSGGTASLTGNTVSFTTVNSISLNGCFTSSYRNYQIAFHLTAVSAAGPALLMRLRAAGADNTTSNYYHSTFATSNAGGGGNFYNGTANGITTFYVGQVETNPTVGMHGAFDMAVMAPQEAARTAMMHQMIGAVSATGYIIYGGCGFAATTQFDGFTIYPASGTITGTVSVYGMTK